MNSGARRGGTNRCRPGEAEQQDADYRTDVMDGTRLYRQFGQPDELEEILPGSGRSICSRCARRTQPEAS